MDATAVVLGDTVTLELWVQADTKLNGFSAALSYDGSGLGLRETADGGDSFPTSGAGVQVNEDHTVFGDVLRNRGSWTGAASDTLEYVALTNADSVVGSYRACVLTFTAQTVGSWTVNYVLSPSTGRVTAIAAADGFATDILTSQDSGVVVISIIDTRLPNVWYVNDTSTVGDSFTFVIGADTQNGLTRSTPKRNITAVTPFLTVGDTIFIDAGTFDSIVTVSATESAAIRIDTNTIWVIGVDSTKTIIDPIGANSTRGLYGIYADTQVSLTIRNLAVTGANYGIYFYNVDLSTITQDSVSSCGDTGVLLQSGSDSNSVTNISATRNYGGIRLVSSSNNTINGNAVNSNMNTGIHLISSSNDTVSGNTASSNWSYGILLNTSSNNNRVSGNTANSNNAAGIYLNSNSNNSVSNNTANFNSWSGIYLSSSSNNTVMRNTLDSNVAYQIYIDGTSSSDTVQKNNIKTSPTNSDSGVYNGSGNPFDFTRNYWFTTDTSAIKRMIAGSGRDSVIYTPFRLGIVDTAAGADTVAPNAPDTVGGVGTSDSTVLVTWSASAGSEEPEVAAGLAGYRIYRSPIADTSVWILVGSAGAGVRSFADSGFASAETRYYRVTAFDAANPENQSFYSDSIAPVRSLNETVPPSAFTLTSPSAGEDTRNNSLTFRWSTSFDSSMPMTYRLIVDTDMAGSYLIDTTVTETFVTVALPVNDTYRWRVVAADSYGNTTQAGDSTFVIDTTSPTVPVLLQPAAGAETKVLVINFTWSASADSPSGLSGYRLQIDTAGNFLVPFVDSFTPVTSASETLAANDTYSWRVIAVDDAGNTVAAVARLLYTDTESPISPVSAYPVALSETNAASVGFVWSASTDTLTGLAAYHLQVDTSGTYAGALTVDSDIASASPDTNVPLVEGVYWWRVLARDDAGNTTSYTAPIQFVVDRTAPVIVVVTLVSNVPTFFTDSGGINVAAAEDTVFFNNEGIGAGQNVIATVTATGADSVTFPQVFADGPFYDSVAAYAFTYSIESGLGDTVTILYARDTAGNFDSMTIRWIRDSVPPPAVSQQNPADSQILGDTTPTLTWLASVDTLSGTVAYTLQIAADSGFSLVLESTFVRTLSYTSIGLNDSIYYWRVIGQDSVSNADTLGAIVRSFRIDSGFPSVTAIEITSSAPNYFYDDTPVTPGATPDTVYYNPTGAGAGQVDTIRVYVQDLNETMVVGSSAFTPIQLIDSGLNFDSYLLVYRIPLDAGPATITIVASDATGFEDTVLVRFESDTYAPTPAVPMTPADGHETSAMTVLFTWAASMDTGAGVSGYRLQIDTTVTFAAPFVDSVVGNVTSASRTLPANDTYYWRLVASDYVSNTDTGPSQRLVIDTTSPFPAATLSLPADLMETNVQTISFAWTAAMDTGTGVNGYRLQLDTLASFLTPLQDSFTPSLVGTLAGILANDTYLWRVVSIDDAGNTVASTPRTFFIDTELPIPSTLSAPADGTETNVNTILFSWTTAFDSFTGLREHRLQIDTTNTFVTLLVDSSTGLATSGTRTLPGTETYYWRVIAVDSASNETVTSSRRLVVDTTPPIAGALGAPLTGHDTNSITMTFSWGAAVDTGTGVAGYRLQIDTANTFMAPFVDSMTTLLTGTRTLSANDTYYWRVVAVDDAGNTVAVAPNLIRVDTTPPVAGSLTSPVANLDTSSMTILFSWTAGADTLSGVVGYRLQIDTANTFAAPFVNVATGLVLSGQQTLPANDTYYWRVIVTDSATNTDTYASRRLRVDTTPPIAPILVNKVGDTFITLVTLVWNPSFDSHTGIASYVIQVDTAGTFVSLNESTTNAWNDTNYTSALTAPDTYWWRVIAYDSAGNSTVSAFDTFRIVILDTAPPAAFAFTTPGDLHETRAVTFLLRWTDSLDDTSPPVRYRVQVDTVGTFASSFIDTNGLLDTFLTATFAANETSFWRVIATDNAGNTTTITGGSRRVIVDTFGPSGSTLTSPTTPHDTTARTILFTWTAAADTISGVNGYKLQIDTSAGFASPLFDSFTTAFSGTGTTLVLNDTYWWRVVVVDDAGNTTVVGPNILRVDTASPVAGALLAPVNNHDTSVTALSFSWAAAVDSVSGVSGYRLQIDTAGTFATPFTDTTTTALTLTILNLPANETSYWRVIVIDTAGNTTPTASRLFRVDTQGPIVGALSSPIDLLDTSATVLTFAWAAASDSVSGVTGYRLQVDTVGTFAAPFVDSSTGLALTAQLTFAANDTYYWRVVAVDSTGNTSPTASRRFRIDTTSPPVVTLIKYNGDTVAALVTLRWILSLDTQTGIASYVIQVDTAGTFASVKETATNAWNDTDYISAMVVLDTYWWRVIAYDSVGNSSTSAADSFRLFSTDTLSPGAFAFTTPADLHETRAVAFLLRWTDSLDDTSPPVRYRVQVDTAGTFAAPYIDTPGLIDTFLVATFAANETSSWRVIAIDNAGNTTAITGGSRRVVVDTAGPVAGSLIAPIGPTDTSITSITFRWNAAADTGTGVNGYRLQIDTANTFMAPFVDSATTLTSGVRTLSANDTYYWRVIAIDDAGNTMAVSANTLRVDTLAPVAGAASNPAANIDTTATTITFTWTAASDSVGIASYRLQIDTSNTFTAPFVDSATTLLTGIRTLPANDTYYWRIVAVDNSGNTVAYTSFRIRIDTSAPAAASSVIPVDLHDTTNTSPIFQWTAPPDSGSGIASYRLQIDTTNTFTAPFVDSITTLTSGARTLPANDTYFWRVIVVDNAGNTTANTPRRLRIDTAAPSMPTLTRLFGDSTLAPVTLRWTASSDSIVGVLTYTVQIDTSGAFATPLESSAQVSPDTDYVTGNLVADTYWWRVIAHDSLGNSVASSSDSFMVRTGDTAPPSAFALTSPASGSVTGNVAVTFSWQASIDVTSPPVVYRLQVDTAGNFTAPFVDTSWLVATSASMTLPANDTYWWRVIARDNVLNTKSSQDTFRIAVDTRPPTLPILTRKAGASVNSPVYLAWRASTDSIAGLARYLVQVDNESTFVLPHGDSAYLIAGDTDHWTVALAVDTWYWRVTAVDSVGNAAISATDSFRVAVPDSTGPTFVSASADTSAFSNSGTTTVTFTMLVTDSTYVASVRMKLLSVGGLLDSTAAVPSTPVPSTDSRWTLAHVFDTTVSGDTYDLVVYAYDANGNYSTTTIRVVVRDPSPSMALIIDSALATQRLAGDAVSIISTYGDSYARVLYQFRSVPGGGWETATPATPSSNPDTLAPFWGIFWNVTLLPSGTYDVRAVGTDRNGVTDPSPGVTRIFINPSDSTVHEYRDALTGLHIRRQKFNRDTAGFAEIADGTALEVPAGALTDSGWIRITIFDTAPTTSPVPGFLVAVSGGTFREFTREAVGGTFAKDVTITLPYADTDALNDNIGVTAFKEADLAMYYFDTAISSWVPLATSHVDYVRNVVTATVNHFTRFALFAGQAATSNLSNIRIFPNPFVPNDANVANGTPYDPGALASGIVFDLLPVQVSIDIYDIAGRRIASMSKNSAEGRYRWDARGDDGRELASGVYIAVIRSSTSGEQVIRKVMIIR